MRFVYILLVSLAACIMHAAEHIILFDAQIRVQKDAMLTVREEITVKAAGGQIKHGIVREFPTHYIDPFGNNVVINFVLQQVLLDDKPVTYKTEHKYNGTYIYIGDPHIYLAPGMYTFTLVYTVNRTLGFFATHDELYWNVTGNGWRLPINRINARVMLPEGIDSATVQAAAYTGAYGEEGADVQTDVLRNGTIRFKSTKPFMPYEGMTIVVGWPKGFVTVPNVQQKMSWFLQDNKHYICFFAALMMLFALFAHMYRENKRRRGYEPVIPLFYPPKDMSPGLVHYIDQKGYSDTALAAEIVYMAVKGWLTIESTKDFWSTSYTLIKKNVPEADSDALHEKLWKIFFPAERATCTLDSSRADDLTRARVAAETSYMQQAPHCFKMYNKNKFIVAVLWAASLAGAMLLHWPLISIIVLWFLLGLVIYVGFYALRSYSEQGFKLKREIDGFKLFLTVTEKDRMAMIGTPPTESPQLYETYLPYAMALGVERQWSEKFTAMFERLKKSGYVYSPLWFIGPRTGAMLPTSSFSSGFTRSLSSSISSAVKVPGSTSGLGGRSGGGGGFSGGGGGGGGGGGW